MFMGRYIRFAWFPIVAFLGACGGEEESNNSGYDGDNSKNNSPYETKENTYKLEGNDIHVYWNFNDDEIMNGFGSSNVSVQGAIVAEGISGNAFYFDGNSKVEWSLPAQRRLDEFTLAFWVKSEGMQQETYASVFSNDSQGLDFQIDTNGANPGSYQFRGETTDTFYELDNDWVHITVTKDLDSFKFYVDGLLVKEMAPQGVYFQTFRIGRNRVDSRGFVGWVDEFLFINKVLNEDEINTVAGSPNRPNTPSNPDTPSTGDPETPDEMPDNNTPDNEMPDNETPDNNVPPEEPEINYAELFNENVAQASCVACHNADGIAGGTPLVFSQGNSSFTADNNYSALANYLAIDDGNSERLRNKVLGLTAHGGGKVLDENSTALETLDSVLAELTE